MPRPTALAAAASLSTGPRQAAEGWPPSAPRAVNFGLGLAGLAAIVFLAERASPEATMQGLLVVALVVGAAGLAANLIRISPPAPAAGAKARESEGAGAELSRADPAQSREPIADLRVLVAEDNPLNQLVVHALLNGLVGSLTIVNDGMEALEALRRQDFDLVLMDVNMPHLDGSAAVAAVRAGEAGRRDTSIVALTAEAMAGDAERLRAAGFDAYLAKPFRPAELLAIVARCTRPAPAARRAAA
ncbi:response regulator [Phenylobacterium terrae]|uniref:Response regulator n=1 Tax=Phenylobacterium terrae TaxID=2665495 RepID=A0ABW4N1P7_9CAUL